MDAVFAALADPVRRSFVERLARGSATVGELGKPWPISKPAVTKHLKVLERARLVRRQREGRVFRCTLLPDPLNSAEHWIEQRRQFWERSVDRLAAYVKELEPRSKQ